MASLRPAGSSFSSKYDLESGCQLTINSQTGWLIHKVIDHKVNCQCTVSNEEILRMYLYKNSFENYYMDESKCLSVEACDAMVEFQAERLDIDLEGMDMKTVYPQLERYKS
ncbi:hypothetical protein GGS21DRAFT_486754 [Xylaria nigripes]|nr:hypothetical protein GGS21DRAFT_486754 [Xylaria nigripes]